MLRCSAPTQSDRPASDQLRARVSALAHELAVADPVSGGLGDLFDYTFVRPATDAEYQTNRLQPGAFPLEWSFSEADAGALRFELQPFDPTLPGGERLRCTLQTLLPVIEAHFGSGQALRFESAARLALVADSKLNFGAFMGVVQRPRGDHELKIYVERSADDPTLLSNELSKISGIVPHFHSITVSDRSISQRTYYLCRDGLRALDLENVCLALGIAHRFPALLLTMLELTDGQFHLPPSSVLLGIRRDGKESELKVELVCGTAISPSGLIDRIERLLQPNTVALFRRWAELILRGRGGKLPVSVVSIKTSTMKAGRLSIYAPEPWGAS